MYMYMDFQPYKRLKQNKPIISQYYIFASCQFWCRSAEDLALYYKCVSLNICWHLCHKKLHCFVSILFTGLACLERVPTAFKVNDDIIFNSRLCEAKIGPKKTSLWTVWNFNPLLIWCSAVRVYGPINLTTGCKRSQPGSISV